MNLHHSPTPLVRRWCEEHRQKRCRGWNVRQNTSDAGTLLTDLLRHACTLIGVVGLVGITTGALTDARWYHSALDWLSSFFI